MSDLFHDMRLQKSLTVDEVRHLHVDLVAFLAEQPPKFEKDESLGSWGGDPRLLKRGRGRREK